MKITTLPAAGTLTLDGNAVTAGEFVQRGRHRRRQAELHPGGQRQRRPLRQLHLPGAGRRRHRQWRLDLDQSANTITVNVTSVNDAPAGTDKTVTDQRGHRLHVHRGRLRLQRRQRRPANALAAVKITTLPTAGTLTLDGVAGRPPAQFVSAADIAAGKLDLHAGRQRQRR